MYIHLILKNLHILLYYIYNTLTNTLKNYAIKETSVESLVKHANYAYFLKTMIKHQ